MHIPVIVVGAAGRMGLTITAMVEKDPECRLAGLVETAERLPAVRIPEGVPAGSSLDSLLPVLKGGVVIDFTVPEYSLAVAKSAAEHGLAHVIGTTGLTVGQRAELEGYAGKTPIFWSPNMSVGVNVLVTLLPELARMLGPSYDMEVLEIHHRHKKDAPSGTALRLAEVLAGSRDWGLDETSRCCREGITGERPDREIGIQALRGGDVAGVHTAYFFGSGERIEVTHQAHSRDNFAQGALRAAKWLCTQKPGRLYTMQDMF